MSEQRTDLEADLHSRWVPSPEQTVAAVAVLNTLPEPLRSSGRFFAVVPLALPGKEYGIWEAGQQVVPVPGVWLAENTSGDEPTAYPFGAAKAAAENAADAWLAGQGLSGTVSVALIDAEGAASLFEWFSSSKSGD